MDLVTIFHTSPSPVLLRHGPLTFSSFLSLPLPRLLYIYLSFLVFQSRGQGRSKIPRFRVLYSCLRMPKSRRRTQSFFFLLIFAILSFPLSLFLFLVLLSVHPTHGFSTQSTFATLVLQMYKMVESTQSRQELECSFAGHFLGYSRNTCFYTPCFCTSCVVSGCSFIWDLALATRCTAPNAAQHSSEAQFLR